MTFEKIIRIGGGSAFFIDSALAVPQLLAAKVDYIIFDYLAEAAMGLLGRMRMADADSGFPSDFIDVHVGPHLGEIAKLGVRIIANAGGVNPAGLAVALRHRCAALGLRLKIACITGDDLFDRAETLHANDTRDMFNGAPLPSAGITSINAYLGAQPIAAALAGGADIVITGRVVDSALALGSLIHEFGWSSSDLDLLAAGTLAGHLIECGTQVTGGTFTDWREVPDWANIGAPIAECSADGHIVITKPDGTGGLVSIGTVSEQLLYETGDPQCYFVPDVTCDFSEVTLTQLAPNRVGVAGARGSMPTSTYKACATFDQGWRAIAYQPVIGPDAVEKANRQAVALFARGRKLLTQHGLDDFSRCEAILIGAGASLGPRHFDPAVREVVLKLVVEHNQPAAVQMFAREQFSAISAMAPGTSISFGTQVQQIGGLLSFLIDKAELTVMIDHGSGPQHFVQDLPCGFDPAQIQRPATPILDSPILDSHAKELVSLAQLAWVRSGEKGEMINIGVIARHPDHLPWLRAALTPAALGDWFGHLFTPGTALVSLYDLPGLNAFNIVLEGALTGGINASQRLDPAAKSIGQQLLDFPVPICRA